MYKKAFALLLLIMFYALGHSVFAAVKPPVWPERSRNTVYYIPQFSEFESISDGEMRFFRKTLERAAENRARAVILELDTPGGSVETAFKYLSIMEKSSVPIIVYLNPNGISAGMIIALGADRVAISANGLIGDAMPIQMGLGGAKPVTDPGKKAPEKSAPAGKKPAVKPLPEPVTEPAPVPPMLQDILEELRSIRKDSPNRMGKEDEALVKQKFLTVFFKMLQVLAEKNNRPVNVVRAMADPYVELDKVKDGFEHKKRSPLTLSAREAKTLGVVDYVAVNRSDLLQQLGLQNAEVVEVKRTATEQLGAFLATPAIAGLLLVIGLLGIFVEVKTPGFGVPGVLGISALTLFFLGHIASGASDWGPMVVFFVGLVLIALEIFVIPGFGLVGIMGLLCVLVSFFWAFGFENIQTALRVITLSLTVAITLMILLAIYVLPKTPLFRKVSLETSLNTGDGKTPVESVAGQSGIALTPLRPSGVVKIGTKRFDAVSEGDFIEINTPVEVLSDNGFQLVVRSKNT